MKNTASKTTKNTFAGFPRAGLDFLRDLKKNNDREWFTPRKAIYEEKLRAPCSNW